MYLNEHAKNENEEINLIFILTDLDLQKVSDKEKISDEF
jgi:hypothetical protein